MHIGESESGDFERRKVVKDFCFPEGIKIRKLEMPKHVSKAYKVLYS